MATVEVVMKVLHVMYVCILQWKLKVTSIEVSGIQLHSGLYWCVYSLSAGLCTYLVVPAYSLHTFQYCELVRVQSDCIFALNG